MSESADSSENIRIRDSGASCHYCNSDESLYDNRALSGKDHSWKWKDPMLSKLMKNIPSLLQDVKIVPELWINQFSINKALKNDFKIGNDSIIIHLTNGADISSLDIILKAKSGFV